MSTPAAGQELFPRFKAILEVADFAQRRDLANLWRSVLLSFKGQEAEVDKLRAQLSSAVGAAIPRPATTESVTRARRETSRALEEQAAESEQATITIKTIITLPTEWLEAFLVKRRDSKTEAATPNALQLGCWMSSGVPSHKDYGKINWRTTRHPNPPCSSKRLIGVQPFAHQLAAIVAGDKDKLALTSPGAGYEVRLYHLPEHTRVKS